MGKHHDHDHHYGVVLDAGSSGTRVYIYKWKKNSEARKDDDVEDLKSLPKLKTDDKWTKKVHPGVSTFGVKPELVGTEHLQELIKHALKYIPRDEVKHTPFFMLATAGMRLLPDLQREQLLSNICSYVRSTTQFLLPSCEQHIQVISGETEGLYGWIASNYLLGGFDAPEKHEHGKGHHTYGFLDMGGASAQIAFAPNATEAKKHANDLKLVRFRAVDGTPQEHRVFVTTWLGFGVNEARKRYVAALLESFGTSQVAELPDPCLPKGLLMTIEGKIYTASSGSKTPAQHLIGTGKFDECMRQTNPLLEMNVPCLDLPCLIGGRHVPAIDFDVNHFIGISEYWHTTHEIFEYGYKDKAYDFHTYQKRVQEFCEQGWSDIQAAVKAKKYGKKVDEQTAYEVCFKASWLVNVLHDGIGIPRVGIEGLQTGHNGTEELIKSGQEKGYLDPFQAVNKIHKQEVSWTMGKMLLYASAEVPGLTTDAAPVGFGSNLPGVVIPEDFQYPGGSSSGITNDGLPAQSLTDKLGSIPGFKSDSSHRIPGFIIILLIAIIASFYLCGRDRRARLYTAYLHPNGKAGRLTSHLPPFVHRVLGGRTKPPAHADLEEGAATRLYDPATFELGDVNESDEESTSSKRIESPGPRLKPAAQSGVGSGMTGRISPDLMDRRGLVLRTESIDGLGEVGGRKSRSGSQSPRRMKV